MTELTPQAQKLLEKRYLHPGETCWEDVARRVAHALANNDAEEDQFFEIINDRLFVPNSPTLMNAGIEGGQYSACFLLPVGDSIDEIFDAVKWAAKVHQSGGGTGFNFSELRPQGSVVKGSNGESSGPISFMRVFNEATQQMKQGGRRKGANIGLLSIEHPDIVKFITCKDKDGEFANFNISVAVTDEFMRQLRETPNWVWLTYFKGQKYAIDKSSGEPTTDIPFDLENHYSPPYYTVQDIWNLITKQAWKTADPGLVFWDKIREKDQSIWGVNPCGELPLEPFGACNLGSIDVSKFYDEDGMDWDRLEYTVKRGVDFLNNVIDKSTFPVLKISETVNRSRRIGLGIMGFADLLLKMKATYGSEDSLKAAHAVMDTINTTARSYADAQAHSENRDYNKTVTCIAPTGSISIIAGCSSGIEPNFAWTTEHHRKDFEDEKTIHPLAKPFIDKGEPLPDYFVKASEVSPEDHVKMLAAFQAHVESAVSKTVNLPNDATVEKIDEVYKLAHALGCKGITVYRNGCKQDQVLVDSDNEIRVKEEIIEEVEEDDVFDMEALMEHLGIDEPRPDVLDGFTFKLQVDLDGKVENVYVPVGMLDGRPYELFVAGNLRSVSPAFAQFIDSLTRMTSLALRWGIPLDQIADQLEKTPEGHMYSVPHKIAQIIRSFIAEEEVANGPKCPDCGEPVRFESGCISCSCGWSKCS